MRGHNIWCIMEKKYGKLSFIIPVTCTISYLEHWITPDFMAVVASLVRYRTTSQESSTTVFLIDNIMYVHCGPSLELSGRDCSNERYQCFYGAIRKIIPKLSLLPLFI